MDTSNKKSVLRVLDSFAKGIGPTASDEAVREVTAMAAYHMDSIIVGESHGAYWKGREDGFEDLAKRVEDIGLEFITDPRHALVVIEEWIGESRHARDKEHGVNEFSSMRDGHLYDIDGAHQVEDCGCQHNSKACSGHQAIENGQRGCVDCGAAGANK